MNAPAHQALLFCTDDPQLIAELLARSGSQAQPIVLSTNARAATHHASNASGLWLYLDARQRAGVVPLPTGLLAAALGSGGAHESTQAAYQRQSSVMRAPVWTLDVAKAALHTPEGIELALSPTETRLLQRLARAPAGEIIHRDLIRDWLSPSSPGPDGAHSATSPETLPPSPSDRAINMAISRLRHKARKNGQHLHIEGVAGLGYVLLSPVRLA